MITITVKIYSNISSSNNVFVSIIAFGEGAHNYHHVFPWDYKTAESKSYFFNLTLLFLDLCTKFGLAYEFKVASPEMIQKRKLRTGNGRTDVQSSERQVRELVFYIVHNSNLNSSNFLVS